MCPTACMKECEKFNPYRDSIRGPLYGVSIQEVTNDTVHCLRCGAFSVRGAISEVTLI
jgi:hypothetical protein